MWASRVKSINPLPQSTGMLNDRIWGNSIALVVIDAQRKFSLTRQPDWEGRMKGAVDGINAFAGLFREHGRPVVFIHFDGASHTGYDGEDGDEWLPGIETSESDIVIHKRNMNCFKDTELESTLADLGIDCAIYTGMLTEFCVVTTFFGSLERGFFPYLGKGALISYYEEGNRAAEVLCNTVDTAVAKRFLDGEQPPMEFPDHHRTAAGSLGGRRSRPHRLKRHIGLLSYQNLNPLPPMPCYEDCAGVHFHRRSAFPDAPCPGDPGRFGSRGGIRKVR